MFQGRGSSSSGGSTPLLLWLLALRVSASALTEKTTNDTTAGKGEEEARGAKTIALEVSRKVREERRDISDSMGDLKRVGVRKLMKIF